MIVNIGMDLASVERFVFSPRQTAWFSRRVFTDVETNYAARKRYPQQHLAGAFAAKEAFRKAVGRSIPWRAVGLAHNANGAPCFEFGPEAQAALDALGLVRVHVSLTHTASDAAAVVVIEQHV